MQQLTHGKFGVILSLNNLSTAWGGLDDGLEVSSSSVSIEENSLTVGVYPNPAADVLNVTSSNELSTVTIIGMDGKVISTSDVNGSNASIEISTLNAGVYFYEVLTVDGTIRNTFVKK